MQAAATRECPSTKIGSMKSFACPRCGGQVVVRQFFNLADKPFCPRCGWNLGRADSALAAKSSVVKLMPFLLAFVVLIAVFATSNAHAPALAILPVLFSVVLLVPVWSYYSARKAIAAAKLTANPGLAVSQPPLPPELQMLQSLPRPRKVRFRFGDSVAAIAIAIAAIAVVNAIAIANISRRPGPVRGFGLAPVLPFLAVGVVFAVAATVPLFREKRNLPLLRDGELAFGRVVSQQTVQQGKASYSRIDYEFQTNTGQQMAGSCRDLTRSAFEDMAIPVFYDPLNPSKNITPCATYFKVVNSFQ